MANGPKAEVSSVGAVLLEALKAFIESEFGEDSGETSNVVEGVSVKKRYSYSELQALTLVELRAMAKEAGCPSSKKAEILSWFQKQELEPEAESDEDTDEEEEDNDEEEDDEESEESDEESELREQLSNLTSVGLRNRIRKNLKESGEEVPSDLKTKSDEDLIDLIVELELEQPDDDEEEDEEESEETEESEEEDDDAIDLDELMDKKKWPMPKLLKFAEENEVDIPSKIKGNRQAIVDLLSEALGEDSD